MQKEYYDIIIIGAGLAGLSALGALPPDQTVSVAVVEKNEIGSNDPSPLTFSDVIAEHGLSDCVKARCNTFSFHNYTGSSVTHSFTEYPLAVLDYKKACKRIFADAEQGQKDLDFIHADAHLFSNSENGVVLRVGGGLIKAKMVIDASGGTQLTAAARNESSSLYSHVYGSVFSGISGKGIDRWCFLWPCYAFGIGGGWYYALQGANASFGYATVSSSPVADRGVLQENFYRACKQFFPYSAYLSDALYERAESGIIPIQYIKKMVYGNIITVGDAAGMATNWTCMGIEPALTYGRLAGRLCAKALLYKDYAILNDFQKCWDTDNKPIYDFFARVARRFWVCDYKQWEWIIKNDLAFLSPGKMLDRIRYNKHILKKHQILLRAVRYRLRSLLNKKILQPDDIEVRE